MTVITRAGAGDGVVGDGGGAAAAGDGVVVLGGEVGAGGVGSAAHCTRSALAAVMAANLRTA